MRIDTTLNRREFLKRSAAAAVGAGLAGCAEAAEQATDPGKTGTDITPLSELDAYNYIVGTQTFSPKYQFTSKPRLLETAEAIREMGASVIKLKLDENKRRGTQAGGFGTLRDVAMNDPVIRQILNMTFGHYILWAYPLRKARGSGAEGNSRDEEIYDLCCYLLSAYSGTRKTFYLGHWEGDWELRGKAGGTNDPAPDRIASKIRWLNRRQKAVDDAKRDTRHTGIEVFCYAEVNLVRDAMKGRPTMTNDVLPKTQVDFVSYSSYDTANGKNAVEEVPRALDHIESKLPAKPGIKGKRVWIGEYGYPACNCSPQEQEARSRQLIKTALQWGCPFVLYWEMYNNEIDKEGKQRGFWLIDDKGVKQPVYHTHRRFCEWARGYVADFAKTSGRVPRFEEYQKEAVAFLDRL